MVVILSRSAWLVARTARNALHFENYLRFELLACGYTSEQRVTAGLDDKAATNGPRCRNSGQPRAWMSGRRPSERPRFRIGARDQSGERLAAWPAQRKPVGDGAGQAAHYLTKRFTLVLDVAFGVLGIAFRVPAQKWMLFCGPQQSIRANGQTSELRFYADKGPLYSAHPAQTTSILPVGRTAGAYNGAAPPQRRPFMLIFQRIEKLAYARDDSRRTIGTFLIE